MGGNCVLKSGHRLSGETIFLHICKFCYDYRGEKNSHSQEECKLKRKLLKEVECESQVKRKSDASNEKTRNEKSGSKIRKEETEDRSPRKIAETPQKYFKDNKQVVNDMSMDMDKMTQLESVKKRAEVQNETESRGSIKGGLTSPNINLDVGDIHEAKVE